MSNRYGSQGLVQVVEQKTDKNLVSQNIVNNKSYILIIVEYNQQKY